MIKGLIFDFDGLILDTESPEFEAWQEIFAQHGCELSMAKWGQCIGSDFNAFNPLDELEALLATSIDRAAVLTQQRQISNQRLINKAILPGVSELLHEAHQNGLKVAIASSSSSDWVVQNLTRLGILEQFDFICTANDVLRAKPAPDLFLCALNRLGLQPDEVIIFEDSFNGITAARMANLFSVAVPNQITRQMDFSAANLILDSLADCHLHELFVWSEQKNHS